VSHGKGMHLWWQLQRSTWPVMPPRTRGPAATPCLHHTRRRVGVSPPLDDTAVLKVGLPRLNRVTKPAVMRMEVLDLGEEVRSG
jgi:hypothetical protein